MTGTRPIYFTNTLGHELQEFQPINPSEVLVYSCGPTVYSYAHIGNFRAFIFADTLRRMLEYNGYRVRHVRNITDVGHLTDETLSTGLDRIEKAAREQATTPWDIARYYTEAFLADAERLNLLEPEVMPRATEYIAPMISLTERLIEDGHAYEVAGDVYYDVNTFPSYGALSGNTVEDLVAGARVEVGEHKRSPADFALWRVAGPEKLMRWPSPWGEGVPGWHIECSAMSMCLLDEQIDIHTGAIDNIFPHHEDERAQSEAATGKLFVRYWLHNDHLRLAGDEKMSKSLGNIYTIQDLVDWGFHPLAFRYFTYQAHYRTPLIFSSDALSAAQTALYRLWEAASELSQSVQPEPPIGAAEEYRARFHSAINRDLDLPGAVAVVHDFMGSSIPAAQKLGLLEDVDRVLGLRILQTAHELSRTSPEERALLEQRKEARARREWPASDRLRDALARGGLDVKDTTQGQRWVRRDLLPAVREQPAE